MQRWEDGSGRITVVRSKTDAEAQGAVVAITPAAMEALPPSGRRGLASDVKVFGLSESQIARRVKAIAKAAGLEDWEFFSGHSGRVGMARRMAQNGAPTHEIERQGRWKQGGGMVGRYTRGESPPGRRCGTFNLGVEKIQRLRFVFSGRERGRNEVITHSEGSGRAGFNEPVQYVQDVATQRRIGFEA